MPRETVTPADPHAPQDQEAGPAARQRSRAVKKMPNGEGTVFAVKGGKHAGKWRCALTFPDGTRVERLRPTEEAARDALAELVSLREREGSFATERVSLVDYLDYWLSDVKALEIRGSTMRVYTTARDKVEAHFRSLRLRDVRPAHLDRFRGELARTGYAPRTINQTLTVLSGCLLHAYRRGIIASYPAEGLKQVQVPHRERARLSREEVERLLEVAAGSEWCALWALQALTGLRCGEALALRWEDIDADRLRVHRTVTSGIGSTPKIGPPKTQASRRVVPLPAPLLPILVAHSPLIKLKRMLAREWDEQGLLFPDRTGGPRRANGVSNAFQFHIHEAGIERHLTPHALRHTFATLHLAAGTQLAVVQRLMGHASISMTADLYTHVERDVLDDAAARLASLFA